MRGRILVGILALLLWAVSGIARAESQPAWLTDKLIKSLFPNALYAGPLGGDPPAAAVYSAGTRLGYVFITSDIVEVIGFSGAPFTIAVGLDMDGVMTGVKLIKHAEPILDYNSSTAPVVKFFDQYLKLDYTGAVRLSAGGQAGDIDGISTATISARSFHHAIIQSARTIARTRGLRSGDVSTASVDTVRFEPLAWAELVDSGAVQRLQILSKKNDASSSSATTPDRTDLHLALLNPASIGRNLVSRSAYRDHVSSRSPRDLIVALMSNGPYSFVGSKVFDTGTFDRIRIVQGDKQYPLIRELGRYHYLPFVVADGAPTLNQIGIFTLPAQSGIDVLAAWQLIVSVTDDNGAASNVTDFKLNYRLPERFVLPALDPVIAAPASSPIRSAWEAQRNNVAILVGALGVLTVLLTQMAPLTRRPRLFRVLRTGFLLFTLVWLGWIAGAQLSVINPIGWGQALASGAGLGMLLSDPLLVVLTVFVLISFFAWGRGVFCGWLCPFGALQELLAGLARQVGLAQISLSHRTHQLLWPLKYLVLGGLVIAAWHAPATLGIAAEVEPFKTVISLRFERTWPYVVYASVLLVGGLFIERAFCRFLCPLGALLAIGGKLRITNPLMRRAECGSPCQLCTRRCPIQAIAPSGQINMDECFYCLDCQVIYRDDKLCPPLVSERKRVIQVVPVDPVVAGQHV